VDLDGNITAKTVASIRDALQLSSLVFSSAVCKRLERAHGIAFRLQGKPFELQTDQYDQDKDALTSELATIIEAMTKEAKTG
jgi:hypothetical protein